MNDFTAIYRILKALSAAIDDEEFDPERLSAEALGTTERRRNAMLVMLLENGYISGVEAVFYRGGRDPWPRARLASPRITLKGLEYLQENSIMQKCAKIALGIADRVL